MFEPAYGGVRAPLIKRAVATQHASGRRLGARFPVHRNNSPALNAIEVEQLIQELQSTVQKDFRTVDDWKKFDDLYERATTTHFSLEKLLVIRLASYPSGNCQDIVPLSQVSWLAIAVKALNDLMPVYDKIKAPRSKS